MYRLLIVDDEEDIRRGMARGIPWEEWGFQVIGQAENGEEAVGLIEAFRPDVVLSDIKMPKMDGIELMQYLHVNEPETRIIILSGYNDVKYLSMAIKNQVTEYLLKPTDIDEFEALFHRLKAELDEEKRQRQELEDAKASLHESRELSYSRVLNNILDGYVGDSIEYEWKREMEEAGLRFDDCALIVLDTALHGEEGDSHYRLKRKIIKYCNDREDTIKKQFCLHRSNKVIGIVTIPEEVEGMAQVHQYVKEIQAEIVDIYGLALLAGISPVCRDENMLPNYWKRAMETVSSPAPDVMINQKKSNLLVSAVKEYLEREYASNLVSLESVAERFRKNPAYISKVFKKETGFNFSDYITQKRMAKSKVLLRDMGIKIYEVAEQTGYADASNFIKVFKKHCGMSPNEYRGLMGSGRQGD